MPEEITNAPSYLSLKIGEQLKTLPDDIKVDYKRQTAEMSPKTANEIKTLEEKNKDTKETEKLKKKRESTEKRLKWVKTEISKTQNKMGKPPAIRLNGFSLFVSDKVSKAPSYLSWPGKIKYVAKQWNNLPDNIKEDYKELAAKRRAERAKEIQAWTEKNMGTEEMKKLERLMEKKSKLKSKLKEMK